ncbi:hypothetical protein [Dietzia lutea]|uniref:hypothetical protein n=1 Tax=Dietzia lutea TaxID=546160 RepID=UPI001FC906BE|nr:hypothetical protein [Dietzia lutea]
MTLRALADGAALVWGAALPADEGSGRAGLRCTLAAVPGGGYAPVLVVNHKVVDPRRGKGSSTATVTRLLDWAPAPDPTLRVRRHPADLDRLVHAWRLLEAVGHAASSPVGAVLWVGAGGGARRRSRCSTRPTAPTPRDWRWCAVSWTPRPAGSANAAPARGGRGGRTGTGPSRGVAAGWSCPMT